MAELLWHLDVAVLEVDVAPVKAQRLADLNPPNMPTAINALNAPASFNRAVASPPR